MLDVWQLPKVFWRAHETGKNSGKPDSGQVARVFQRAGWRIPRQRGSHVIPEKEGHEATLPVPVHKGNTVNRIDETNQIKQGRNGIMGYSHNPRSK
jgi:predicted RNA binding protein YcfA (HicA-like mRNA interferase family)